MFANQGTKYILTVNSNLSNKGTFDNLTPVLKAGNVVRGRKKWQENVES